MEGGGKQLRVTVKNQGNENAAASKTTVTFLNKPFTLDTPPISAGGSVDLLFNLPSGCFSPDCSFKITADSANQINESSNEGNNSANGRCIG
jgi:subtilase family serine protease